MNTDQPRRKGIAMSEQLKPCPFCGDVPELPNGAGTQYEIECDGCGQAMASVQICDLMTVEERAADNFTNYRYAEEFVERAKHQAVENWNRRADDAALAAKDARIAELEAHCKRLGAGDAERYWEGRWRDADAELSRLRDAATHSEDGGEVLEALSNDEIHQIAFELGGTNDGEYLLTADDLDALVARLNRRAIPVELLADALALLDDIMPQIGGLVIQDYAKLNRTLVGLRALLGKEGV